MIACVRGRLLRRLTAAVPVPALGLALGVVGFAANALPAPSLCSAATYTSHVTLVVEHGYGRVIGLCIGFDGSSITGEQILQASGIEYAVSNYGSLGDAVCQIDHEPESYPPNCLQPNTPYWAMFVARGGGSWSGADKGVSSETFASGDAEGFRYDSQSGAAAAPPSPGGICAAALSGSGNADGSSGGTSGSAPPQSSGAVSGTAPTPSSAVQSVTTPGPTVIGTPSVIGTGAPTPGQRQAATLNPALIVASALGGALLGLVVVRTTLRRRRA